MPTDAIETKENVTYNMTNRILQDTVPKDNIITVSNNDFNITLNNLPQIYGDRTQNTEADAVSLLNNIRSNVESFEKYINDTVDSSQHSENELLNNINLDELSNCSDTLAELEILNLIELAENSNVKELNLSKEDLNGTEILNLDEYEQLMNDGIHNVNNDQDIISIDDEHTNDQEYLTKNNTSTQEALPNTYSFKAANEDDVISISSDSSSSENCVTNATADNLKVPEKYLGDNNNLNNNVDDNEKPEPFECLNTDLTTNTNKPDKENNSDVSTAVNNNASKSLDANTNDFIENQTKTDDKVKGDNEKDGNISKYFNKDLTNASDIATHWTDENSCSSYHSSDFEFITEEEAYKQNHIINNNIPINEYTSRTLKTVEISLDSGINERNNLQNLAGPSNITQDVRNYRNAYDRYEISNFNIISNTDRQNHVIPEADGYFNLFQSNYMPITPFMLENKSTRPLKYVQYEGIGFDLRHVDRSLHESNKEYDAEAEESARRILSMYPEENRRKRRKQ